MNRRPPRVYDADVAALQQRLRGLLTADGAADEREIAGYEAERERVLDLIGDQLREQRDYDARMQRLRAEMAQQSTQGDDWVSGGYEAAHQAHLDALGHTDGSGGEYPIPPDTSRYQDALRHGMELRAAELATERRRVEDTINAPYRHDAIDPAADARAEPTRRDDVGGAELDDADLDDRERVFAETPASPIGGMWFTPDESAPGGVRPLSETELREIAAQVRDTQADAVDLDAIDRQIRETSQQLIDADHDQAEPRGYCRTGDHLIAHRDRAELDDLDSADVVDDGGDQR